MRTVLIFEGFSKETIKFLNGLKRNNNKIWFEKRKKDYESCVREPSRAFVVEMGKRLKTIAPKIRAVPKVNQSLFRLHRDTRFSPDKSPFKNHIGIFFWEGERPRMECSGFYFHLEPPNMMLGVGLYIFPRDLLDYYRNAVVDPETGSELSEIIGKILQIKGMELGGKHYKRIPSGYDSSHSNSGLLLHNGLYAGQTLKIPIDLYSTRLIDYCWEKFYPLADLHRWLVRLNASRH